MKLLHISDTHSFHSGLKLDLNGVDVLVHTGDATNYREPTLNEKEFFDFLDWYSDLNICNKIYVAGNHDAFIYHNKKEAIKVFDKAGIIYLDKQEIIIQGVKFWGDPIQPTFGNWCFMADRSKLDKHWQMIPDDTNVLLTHTPPKNKLDLSFNRLRQIEFCGCSALDKRIKNLKELQVHCFGHIHNGSNIENNGILKQNGVIYSNATSVIDGRFDLGAFYKHGNLIEYEI